MTASTFPEQQAEPREQLPFAALLALAMTGLTAIMTETLPAGLLPQMAQGLSVSEPLAGQVVTAYALGSLAAAVPLVALTQGLRRKPVMLVHRRIQKVHLQNAPNRYTASRSAGRLVQTDDSSVWVGPLGLDC